MTNQLLIGGVYNHGVSLFCQTVNEKHFLKIMIEYLNWWGTSWNRKIPTIYRF